MIQFKLVEIVDNVFFKLPSDSVLNGTLSVNTTAIKSTANCEAPQTFALTTPGTSNFTIDASNSAGCSGSVTFDPGKRVFLPHFVRVLIALYLQKRRQPAPSTVPRL